MSFRAKFGPWVGVPKEMQLVCAVEDCPRVGRRQVCPWDGRLHHHGCVHYDCEAAKEDAARAGLKFRDGWGLLCDEHYSMLRGE